MNKLKLIFGDIQPPQLIDLDTNQDLCKLLSIYGIKIDKITGYTSKPKITIEFIPNELQIEGLEYYTKFIKKRK